MVSLPLQFILTSMFTAVLAFYIMTAALAIPQFAWEAYIKVAHVDLSETPSRIDGATVVGLFMRIVTFVIEKGFWIVWIAFCLFVAHTDSATASSQWVWLYSLFAYVANQSVLVAITRIALKQAKDAFEQAGGADADVLDYKLTKRGGIINHAIGVWFFCAVTFTVFAIWPTLIGHALPPILKHWV